MQEAWKHYIFHIFHICTSHNRIQKMGGNNVGTNSTKGDNNKNNKNRKVIMVNEATPS